MLRSVSVQYVRVVGLLIGYCSSQTVLFKTCNNVMEIVNDWPNLGHIVCKDGDDKLKIVKCRHCTTRYYCYPDEE